MKRALIDHAIRNVWCSPLLDNQAILSATRITRRDGEKVSFSFMQRRAPVPINGKRYHVYQVGAVSPGTLGLLPHRPIWSVGTWISFKEAVERLPLFADLYTDSGIHIPLHNSYYQYTHDRALIFAVEIQDLPGVDFNEDGVFLRLYTNAFYESNGGLGLNQKTRTNGRRIWRMQDILDIQAENQHFLSLPGYVFAYVNGRLVSKIDPFTAKVGDVVEYVYDASVRRVVDFNLDTLRTFTSTLDQTYKYLLHPPKEMPYVIDYHDDVDIYIVAKDGAKFTGHYYHANRRSSKRMVTHQDYSIRVDSVDLITQALNQFISETLLPKSAFDVRIIIRDGGLARPLIFEKQRIHELYKLSDEQILDAMLSVHAQLPIWQVASLEHSFYTELMRVDYRHMTPSLVEACYGYNGITKTLYDTPNAVQISGQTHLVPLSPGFHQRSTVYEYDQNGYLLGFYYHASGTHYLCKHPTTVKVECIVGEGNCAVQAWVGSNHLPWPQEPHKRLYRCYLQDGVPNNQWEDVTATDLYQIENGLVKWNSVDENQYLMVRTDAKFLAYEFDLTPTGGVFFFDLTETINGDVRIMTVPMSHLDIWLNGRSLIEGIDYRVDFPRVVLLNKEYLHHPVSNHAQKIVVRFTGFCGQDMKMKETEDFGFVEHGLLSNNCRYDVRDDRVLRITVRGQLKTRDQIRFSEDHDGISILDPENGSPYQVRDLVNPIRELTEVETYRLRDESVEIDNAVEAYLTQRLPQPERNAVSAIRRRYVVTSPFFSRLVDALQTNQIDRDQVHAIQSDQDVEVLCEPFLSWLRFDPIQHPGPITDRYVVIHPTTALDPIGLSLQSYRFMKRAVDLYGRGHVNLSPHLVVALGGI